MNKTFENLIDISIKQFAENGYYETSLKEISDELGVKNLVFITISAVKKSFIKYV